MGKINMAATMDALASVVVSEGVAVRAYPWPVEDINAPCVVVGYPDPIEFDMTFLEGSDRAIYPVYYVAGRTSDRTTRDQLSGIIAGATSIKTALDGNLDGVVASAAVTDCKITEITVAGTSYLAAQFSVEIYS